MILNREFKLPIAEVESPDKTGGLGIFVFVFFLDCVIADDIQDHNSVVVKTPCSILIFDKN